MFIFQQSSCEYVRSGVGGRINGSRVIEQGNEDDLKAAVAKVGPIAVAVDASSSAFRVGHKFFFPLLLLLLHNKI